MWMCVNCTAEVAPPHPRAGASQSAEALLQLMFYALPLVCMSWMLPLFMQLLVEVGPRTAALEPVCQLLTGAPLFYIVLNQCIGYNMNSELDLGGAKFVKTSRSLGTKRVSFHTIYARFAESCIQSGAELAVLLVAALAGAPRFDAGWLLLVLSSLAPFSLLFGPFLFHPRALSVRSGIRDLSAWGRWLLDPGATGWSAQHIAACERQRSISYIPLVVPSRVVVIGLTFLFILHEALRPLGMYTLVIGLPVLPLAAVALLAAATDRLAIDGGTPRGTAPVISSSNSSSNRALTDLPPRAYAAAAATCGALLVCEALGIHCFVLRHSRGSSSLGSIWACLFLARLYCWRAALSTCIYVDGLLQPLRRGGLAHVSRVLRLTVGAHYLLCDATLGLLLQTVLLVAAVVPFSGQLHTIFLFRQTNNDLERSLDRLELSSVVRKRGRMSGSDAPHSFRALTPTPRNGALL